MSVRRLRSKGDPSWYKDAVIYELHVRAFRDSDRDGIGDFRGLAERLDYLQDLGVTAIWILPFFPSPLKDDGYDTADYLGVLPDYGTVQDFKFFLDEAHRRGLKVITEMVMNHTSDQHAWFQRARLARPGSRERDYYVWSDSPDRYPDVRIIFKDFERSNWTWDPVARAYYWHRFYSHQPDLNYENPAVHREMFHAVDFWLDMGVDGLRLDAIPYLYEKEGTNCENLPETHEFLRKLRKHVDFRYGDRMLLAEANQWPEDAVAYFGQDDECHMSFHFPLMPRLFMSLHMEDRYPIIDILEQTPVIPPGSQWAMFLRNHDELTLEMVTDEERDYMWRVYAGDTRARINLGIRRRLSPLLGNSRRRIELMNSLLFSMPGTPVLYYGDEIGMGDNIHLGDRNGVRTPMQWSADRNAGFSEANPQKLFLPVVIDPEYHYEAVNAEAQQGNPSSILWWMKRIIALRKRFPAFSRGAIEFLRPANRRILAFLRQHELERLLVVANLSRYAQHVELDLAPFRGVAPVELFGGAVFPVITENPYLLTLGPHSFFWFQLGAPAASLTVSPSAALAPIRVEKTWTAVFEKEAEKELLSRLPEFIRIQRWFRSKARNIASVRIVDVISWRVNGLEIRIVLVRTEFKEGSAETYMIPLGYAEGLEAARFEKKRPEAIVTRIEVDGEAGVLQDAAANPRFATTLLEAIRERRRVRGRAGEIRCVPEKRLKTLLGDSIPEPHAMNVEQSNTSIAYGDRIVLKMLRRVEEGTSLELEIARFLDGRLPEGRIPLLAGAIEYRVGKGRQQTLAVLHSFVPNEGDAWSLVLDSFARFLEQMRADAATALPMVPLDASFSEFARLLGLRTGELHRAFSSEKNDPEFTCVPYSPHDQRSLYQSLRNLTNAVFRTLDGKIDSLDESIQAQAEAVRAKAPEILRRFRSVTSRRFTALRCRCHGDFHLGQVLFTGRDFVIMDFEGEPSRSLNERRFKRSPIRDVAGMIRSFHYAAHAAFQIAFQQGGISLEVESAVRERMEGMLDAAVGIYLDAYLEAAEGAPFMPKNLEEFNLLLEMLLLEKAVYELGYELNNRPEWVGIPLAGILDLLE